MNEEEIKHKPGEPVDFGTITLYEETQQLGEVGVESGTADVEIRFCRRIFKSCKLKS